MSIQDDKFPGDAIAETIAEGHAVLDKAAALDLLEQWLDVHPERRAHQFKTFGKLWITLTGTGGQQYASNTQETLASAIRTVLQVAISNGDGLK